MIEGDLGQIWVYLSTSPLMGLTITLVAYSVAHRFYLACNKNPLANPVLTSVAILIAFLMVGDISYDDYFEGGQFVHFLLGPATVALAVPLYYQLDRLKKIWLPVTVAIGSGAFIGALSSILIAWSLGASDQTQLSLAPKSVTSPVAMGISEKIGGIPSLTVVLVLLTGIIGAVMAARLFALLRISDDSVKGIAMGVTAHGIGTAHAFTLSAQMGAFSGLAMGLSALATAIIVPWLVGWLGSLAIVAGLLS
jgi:predicted murein hydrolase (TIGR00659 family)